MDHTYKKEHTAINGNEIYYEFFKNDQASQTFVLLHGFLSSSFSFRRMIPLMTKKYNVLIVDLPPFGKSGKSIRYKYSYENMANTLILLLEKLNVNKVILAGHSMGGQISLNIAYLKPELVELTVLLCSSSYLPRMKKPLIYSSYLPFFPVYVKRYLGKSGLEANLQNVVYNREMIDEEMRQGYLEPFLHNEIFRALTRMVRDREGDLDQQKLRSIQTPCLLIWGEHDRVVPLSIGKRLKEDLPHAELVVIPEAGHLIPEEKPQEVMSVIEKYLNKVHA
ncbi:alpha/beta fold hydrolase [Cytobacillus purgationiresistens]|uniref:Pimeloyl-ACP methyl ester carboxylesterase n=1 Tax=Cytobacillus purgationiresistens TaxID=863449 RepID=A0ABU0AI19_9BACI|nr:alpha/beta hydrolase [Cytobacillus purgationiresistens]MDQ0270897.1 pimeloyl-ACP methyl ester carboxylesterase [Cytobacillus purgationiresistens]